MLANFATRMWFLDMISWLKVTIVPCIIFWFGAMSVLFSWDLSGSDPLFDCQCNPPPWTAYAGDYTGFAFPFIFLFISVYTQAMLWMAIESPIRSTRCVSAKHVKYPLIYIMHEFQLTIFVTSVACLVSFISKCFAYVRSHFTIATATSCFSMSYIKVW
jgi:hypothetical protein